MGILGWKRQQRRNIARAKENFPTLAAQDDRVKALNIVFMKQLTNLKKRRNSIKKNIEALFQTNNKNKRNLLIKEFRKLSHEYNSITKQLATVSQTNKKTRNAFVDPEIQKQMEKAAKYNACLKRAQNACFPSLVKREANAIYKSKKGKIHPNPGTSRSILNNMARSKLNIHGRSRIKETTSKNVVNNVTECIRFTCSPF
jgi:seryl-tRNA synthetase